MTNLIIGAIIYAAGVFSGVVIFRYTMSLTSRLISKTKDGAALDEDITPNEQYSRTL